MTEDRGRSRFRVLFNIQLSPLSIATRLKMGTTLEASTLPAIEVIPVPVNAALGGRQMQAGPPQRQGYSAK
jgi:hypothetical protein